MQKNFARLLKMIVVLLLSMVYFYFGKSISVECVFKRITGIPCVGCGSTRAISYLLKGNVLDALYYNPVTVLLAFGFIILFVICIIDVLFKTNYADKLLYIKLKKRDYAIIILIFLSNWTFNIIKFM